MENINEILSAPEYSYLRENEHLGNHLMFVTFGGSYAHGIPVECSDIDIRGCTVGTRSDILGLSTFVQYIDKQTDAIVYSFFKTVSKIISGDIRMTEMLGCEPEQYAMVSILGRQFIDAKRIFLSQRISAAYIGYIQALLTTLNNAHTRLSVGKQVYEKALLEQCNYAVDKFNKISPGAAKAYIQQTDRSAIPIETVVDIHVEGYPVRELSSFLTATAHVVESLENAAAGRNYFDRYWTSKKMTELLRAMYTCCELLETGVLRTCRTVEKDTLLSVRDGRFVRQDATVDPGFFEFIKPLQQRLDYARKNTILPEQPNISQIDDFVIDIYEKALQKP